MNLPYVICAYLALFVLGMIDMARGPIYPEILGEFAVGTSVGSYFFTVASLAGLLVNLVSHWWLARWGAFRSLQVFTFLQFWGCFGMAWAADLQQGFIGVLFFSFLFGTSLGGTGIIINLLVVDGSPDAWRGRLLSGLHTMYGLAALTAPLLVTRVLQVWHDWRVCFYLMSIGPLILFFYTFTVPASAIRAPIVKKPTRLSRLGWQLAVAMALYVGAEMTVSTRMVVYLRHELQWSADQSSLWLSLFFLGLMVGRLFHSLWGGGWREKTVLFSGTSLSLISFLVGLWIHPVGLALCGLTMAAVFPTFVAFSARIRRSESERIVSMGIAGVGVVLIFMHWSVGFLAEALNMRLALMIGPLFLAAVLVMLAGLKKGFSEGNSF